LRSFVLQRVRPAAPIEVPLFAATIFLSACLMFLVEPMIARLLLPRLGGAPAVWSTCLVFFQAILLFGYAYVHVITRVLSRHAQILVHVGLVLPLAALTLPLDFGTGAPPPTGSSALWLLTRLTLVAGPTLFAISATAPLLQVWFAGLDRQPAGNPYFLYAASNAGSLLALLAYPLLIEPGLALDSQTALWSRGWVALAAGVLLCAAVLTWHGRRRPRVAVPRERACFTTRDRLRWTALAAVPSSLLLGVTAHISTDIAAVPLLWVVPLALYLLTFILVFARRVLLPHAVMVRVLPLVLIPLVIIAAPGIPFVLPLPVVLGFHLGCFFVVCMVCHGALARLRPASAHLAEFYLFLSIGGVLGGVFNALLAPLIFPAIWEYPLALVAACLLRPATPDDSRRGLAGDILLPLALLAVLLAGRSYLSAGEGAGLSVPAMLVGYVVPAMALLYSYARRWRFALGIAICLVVPMTTGPGDIVTTLRSFFGVYRVALTDNGQTHLLRSGTTLHGAESLLPGEENLPMTYYSHDGPFGRFFAALDPNAVRHVAVIGLGAGTLACYAQPGQDWTFYEIDPTVERIARDPRYFHFLANCGNHPIVIPGDARLTIAAAPDGSYDVLVIDAFSSDSIPVHLLTREALALYLRKLAPGGKLLFHISSRTLNLAPVIWALASDAGVPALMLSDRPPGTRPGISPWQRLPADVVAVAGHGGDLSRLDPAIGWVRLPPGGARSLWTDQQSDILGVIRLGS
jgi:SAM-dependent methyltransferase